MPKWDFAGGVLRRRGGQPVVRRRRRHTAVSKGMSAALQRLAVSGAPKFRRATQTDLARRRKSKIAPVQKITPTPGLTSHSAFRLGHKANAQVKAMKRVGAPNFYITNHAAQNIATQGFQSASWFGWNTYNDIQTMQTRVVNNVTPIPGTYRTNRYVLESLQAELMITNSSLATAYVEIYDIVRKKDANQTEFNFTRDPVSAWIQGEYDSSQNMPTDFKVINASPFDSQVFKEFFKVVKRTRVEMSQGATHRHAVNLKPNRLINAAMPNFTDGDYAGLTCYTMVVFKGQPASVSTEAGAVVTTAQIALDFVTGTRYKYTWVQDTTQSAYLVDNLSSLANEQVVSCGAGAIVTNAIA